MPDLLRKGLVCGAALMLSPYAMAQAGEASFEEIIVTAQKRDERLQDVPLSISALTMIQIENMGAASFTDYARAVPGLSFIDRGPGRNAITIRGITTGAEQGKQALVGIYFDEMPVSAPSFQPDLNLFDIERVEVLRGPQGTLYGAGSMGGAIKLIAAKPHMTEFAAKADATLATTRHGDESVRFNAMVNAPIVEDKVAVRVVGYYRNEGGYIDNVGLGKKDVNDEETYGGRLSVRFTPNEKLTITANVFFQDTEVGGTQEGDLSLGRLLQSRAVGEIREDDFRQYNLTVNYDLGWAELVSSSTYFDRDFREIRDISSFFGGAAAVWLDNSIPIETFSQEARLASTGDGPFKWLVGVFYTDQRDDLGQLAAHDGLFGLPPSVVLLDNLIENKMEQIAFFGEATYDLTSRLHATVGLRWFDVDQSFASATSGLIAGGDSTDSGDASQNKANPKFLLSYDATDDAMFYAQAAQGFRIGGANKTNPINPSTGTLDPSEYKADTLWNYELGVKTSWLNNRLTINAALYYIDWKDIQITIFRDDGFSYIGNAAKARSKGGELEITARPVDGLNISAAVGYTDAKLQKDAPGLGGLKGDRIPLVPRFTFSSSARYSFALTDALGGFAQFDYQHVGKSYNAFSQGSPDLQRSYDLGHARVGVNMEQWEMSLFVNNLWDERADLFVDTLLGDTRANVNRPRTIGVNLKANF